MDQSLCLASHQSIPSRQKRKGQCMCASWSAAPIKAMIFSALLMCNTASCGKVHFLPTVKAPAAKPGDRSDTIKLGTAVLQHESHHAQGRS